MSCIAFAYLQHLRLGAARRRGEKAEAAAGGWRTAAAAEPARGASRRSRQAVIPNPADQNPCAQSRSPMDMMRHGWSVSLFQAWQQWSTMAS